MISLPKTLFWYWLVLLGDEGSEKCGSKWCWYELVCNPSQKKWKGSLEGSLIPVLFAAELAFLKILVPRLPHQL